MNFQLLFPKCTGTWKEVNLNFEYISHFPELNMHKISDQLSLLEKVASKNKERTFGGFYEDRSQLWEGFEEDHKTMIHLGIDFNNLAPGTRVNSISDGKICSIFEDTSKKNGWGTKVIVDSEEHYFLYGHLMNVKLQQGDTISRGTLLGEIGTPEVNGGWFPHLHLQVMKKKELNLPLVEVDGYEFFPGAVQGIVNPLDFLRSH
mgnify:FL=1